MFKKSLILICTFASLMISEEVLAAGVEVPKDVIFDEVQQRSQKLGYQGYDVTVCLAANNQVILGGLSAWNIPLQIYIVHPRFGSVIPTKRVSDPKETKIQKFNANGSEIVLTLGPASGYSQTVTYSDAILMVGPQEMAQRVTCFFRNSELETPQR